MSDSLKPAIDALERERATHVAQATETEKAINTLCKLAGLPERYAARTPESAAAITSIKGDTFYGRPFSTVTREYLEMRRVAEQGPATVNEIYSALTAGGYQFESKNEDNAKRVLRITLTKNSATFHKLPNGAYGLTEWYPAARLAKKPTTGTSKESDDDGEVDADAPLDEDEATVHPATKTSSAGG